MEKSDWLQDAGAWGHLKVCYVGTAKSTNDCYLTSISYGLEVHRELMKAAITDSLNFKAGRGHREAHFTCFFMELSTGAGREWA